MLEQEMQALRDLPARMSAVELQIVQLRAEMRNEISALREETRSGDDQTRQLASSLHEKLLARITSGEEEMRAFGEHLQAPDRSARRPKKR